MRREWGPAMPERDWDLEGWALNSLEDDEMLRVEDAIASDPDLAAAAQELRGTASALGWAAGTRTPSAGLRDRVLGAAVPARLLRTRRRYTWAWGSVAAACLLAFLGLAFWNLRLQEEMASQAVVLDVTHLGSVMGGQMLVKNVSAGEAAPDCQGALLGSDESRMAYLSLSHLPALPREKAYQVWVTDMDGNRSSAGMVWPDKVGWGSMWIVTPNGIGSIARVGVTEEPAMGSDRPTGPRVASVQVQ